MEQTRRRHTAIRLPAKASVWYIISSAISRGVGVLGTPIFTRLLTPEEYGVYPLYNTWLALFTVACTLELTGSALYRGLQKNENRKREFLCAALSLCIISFSLICILYFTFNRQINSFTGLSTSITSIMLVQILINAIVSLYSSAARYEYKYKSVALINLLSAFLSPIISILIIRFTNIRAASRILGTLITSIIIAIPLMHYIAKGIRGAINIRFHKYLLKNSLPLLPYYLSLTLILRAGEMTIGRIYGTDALGKYSVAMSLGLSLTMISTGALSALTPWILRKLKSGKADVVREFILLLCCGICLLCLVVLSFSPETLKIITPPEYYSALPAVFPLCLSIIPTFISNAVMSEGLYYEKNGRATLPSVAAALISLLLCVAVLPAADYRFASVFTLLSYVILVLLNCSSFKRMFGEYPIKLKQTLRFFLATAAYALLIFIFRDVFLSRMILCLPLIPLIFVVALKIVKQIREV